MATTEKHHQLDEVEMELAQVQKMVWESTALSLSFRITSEGRGFLLQEGIDHRYGGGHLKRAIARHVVTPLARLLGTAQVRPGDVLLIDRHPGEKGLAFRKDREQRSFHAAA